LSPSLTPRETLVLALFLLPLWSRADSERPREGGPFDTVLIVLGNEPLDDSTPTVDMAARVKKAVTFQKEHPATLLVFAGGSTAGTNTEARMMADLALAQGVSTNSIRLEEEARSTRENARRTARFIREFGPRRIFIVSKEDHLEWAIPVFRDIDVFRTAEPLASPVNRADIIAQMENYLKTHDSSRVRRRLQKLKKGERGTD